MCLGANGSVCKSQKDNRKKPFLISLRAELNEEEKTLIALKRQQQREQLPSGKL
jgi:hypothetical protein